MINFVYHRHTEVSHSIAIVINYLKINTLNYYRLKVVMLKKLSIVVHFTSLILHINKLSKGYLHYSLYLHNSYLHKLSSLFITG